MLGRPASGSSQSATTEKAVTIKPKTGTMGCSGARQMSPVCPRLRPRSTAIEIRR